VNFDWKLLEEIEAMSIKKLERWQAQGAENGKHKGSQKLAKRRGVEGPDRHFIDKGVDAAQTVG
jgi:hypothetical protein